MGSSNDTTAVAVSAPGKVLFAGGFLVLDRKHTGLVFGLDARIHVRVDATGSHEADEPCQITVQSPQFREAKWGYCWKSNKAAPDTTVAAFQQTQPDDTYTCDRNVFVATTLEYTLTYLQHMKAEFGQKIVITILADDDYYSHDRGQVDGIFTHFSTTLKNAHKTGLGSSAALVTCLVAALLKHFLSPSALDDLATIHNLAQAAHCAAQGKVGSGFDVAAAVYGSCLYRRFTPAVLERVGDAASPGFGERLHRCIANLELELRWDVDVANKAVQIPRSLLLLMCDVDCGSETPGMVKKVLAWRQEKPAEAELLWSALQQGQDNLCQELTRLAQLDGISMLGHQDLSDIIRTIRSLVREMSEKSRVPIEPPVITELLDYCTSLPGVVGGVAPGAGGYDAVALLVRNDAEVVRDLQDRLRFWKSRTESDTEPVIGKVRLLAVNQDQQGVCSEDPAQYKEWVQQ